MGRASCVPDEGHVDVFSQGMRNHFRAAAKRVRDVIQRAVTAGWESNVLHDVGLRDGYKVVLLPMKAGLAKRPQWSVRQTEAVAYLLPERTSRLKLTEKTQEELLQFLGKANFEAYNISGLTMADPRSLLDKKELARAQKLDRTRAQLTERVDMYAHTWGEKPKPNYKRKELAPLCDWTSDKPKYHVRPGLCRTSRRQ